MPASSALTTTDVDEFRRALRPTHDGFTITGRGRFAASIVKTNLHDLWTQHVAESLPRCWPVEISAARTGIAFSTEPGPSFGWDGAQVAANEIMTLRPGTNGLHTLSGATGWGSMTLPSERLAEISVAVAGRDLTPSRDTVAMSVPSAVLGKLRRLHVLAAGLAESTPEVLADKEAARGLERALVDAMLSCLAAASPRTETAPLRRRATLVKRFRAMAETHSDQALYISDICTALGVPARTLNLCCNEQLGIGPKQYLLLRRLHLARQALRAPDAFSRGVTKIATQFGFWELGRFAVTYKQVFGESPSATLRRNAP